MTLKFELIPDDHFNDSELDLDESWRYEIPICPGCGVPAKYLPGEEREWYTGSHIARSIAFECIYCGVWEERCD